MPFNPKIVQYIGEALKDEGIMTPPAVLRAGVTGGDNIWEQVQATFSDDPLMFSAIFSIEKAKTDEIDTMVKTRLRLLMETLDTMPLANGDAKDSVRRMLGQVEHAEEQGDKMKPIL
jgi:hypothetical protein